jgi:AcrR family transcriptional regulator
MPRHADPELEPRLLDAAQKLWRSGGDKALSMRALARAAKTNTPAIYRRFRDRKDILRALMLHFRNRYVEAIQSSRSLEDAVEAYIDVALKHPREYQLYFTEPTLRPPESRTLEIGPGFAWAQEKCAERFGGSPQDHAALVLAIWAIAHGTVAFLNAKSLPPQRSEQLRAACRDAVAVLLEHAEKRSH